MIVDPACAARALERGQLVAYPTETVYGLGADPSSDVSLERLRALKGRDAASGLSLLLAEPERLERLLPELPDAARRLARRFWPGPLTLVLDASLPALARVRTPDGIGFRCSPHPTARALARAFDRPLVATSCNRSGEPPCRSADDVAAAFGPELVVAGGEPAGGAAPSTVVAVGPDGGLRLLRLGGIALADLEKELEP